MKGSLRIKLAIAFGAIFIVLLITTAYNYYYVSQVTDTQQRVVNLRLTTVLAGKDINNGINTSLAALRGYMILGSDPDKSKIMKQKRQNAWDDIDRSLATFDLLSVSWTVPKNIEIYSNLKQVLSKFKVAQKKVEDIAQSPENIPSYQLLLDEAAPRASVILSVLTKIIDLESSLPPTSERKLLLKLLADSRGSFAIGLANIRAYLLSGDEAFKDNFFVKWQINQNRYDQIMNDLSYLFSDTQQQQWLIYQNVRQEFSNLPSQMFKLRADDSWNQANYLLGTEAAPNAKLALGYLKEMKISQDRLLANDVEALVNDSAMQVKILFVGAVVSLLVSLLMGWRFSNDLLSRIVPLLKKAQEISSNNLSSAPLEIKGNDEISALTEALNTMNYSLTDTLNRTAESIKDVSDEAHNIYCANADMSNSIASQVEQMSLIASAIEELSASAAEVSSHSLEAASSAGSSLDIAQKGGALVDSSLSQMSEISNAFNESATSIESLSKQSKQIEDILGVIRGIAEQTNLLALNAAIEAARAGEQGRGFAVVADEVRQLASRTTEATADVEQAIESMRKDTKTAVDNMGVGRAKVTEGIEISDRVAVLLRQIIERAKDVATKVETIATTSKQQSVVTEEIANNTDKASNASREVSEGISKVVEMAQAVTKSALARSKELEMMVNR